MENNKFGWIGSFFLLLLGYFISGFGSLSGIILFPDIFNLFFSYSTAQVLELCFSCCIFLTLYFLIIKKFRKYSDNIHCLNIIYVLTVCLLTTIFFMWGKASLLNSTLIIPMSLILIMFPLVVIFSIYGSYTLIIAFGFILFYSLIFSIFQLKNKKYILYPFVYLICGTLCLFTYINSPNYKYRNQNHGFEYMGGYSSTDFSDYHVYSENSKLVSLDHEPSFTIDHPEDMPVLDGAEACYPLYAAVAKTLYQNIDQIELSFINHSEYNYKNENGSIVTFYNTAVGFERLVAGDVDIFFGAKPSASQQAYAQEAGVELVYTPIGKEAFVFFVEEDNPIDSLTTDQIRSIYHGDITNWKEVGGRNESIVAFQRPERSGSQSMMVHFMGDVSLKEPLTYEIESSMVGIIKNVAQYQNEAGAIGYSFRYFLEGLNEVQNVKTLQIDNISPSNESIQDGSYPIVATLYCITVKNNDNPNVQKVIDFLLSDDGQYIIEKTGYIPLN